MVLTWFMMHDLVTQSCDGLSYSVEVSGILGTRGWKKGAAAMVSDNQRPLLPKRHRVSDAVKAETTPNTAVVPAPTPVLQ